MTSKIEWTESTWNPVTGCSHAGSRGCDNCYAARLAATRLKHNPRYEGLIIEERRQVLGLDRIRYECRYGWTGEVRCHEDLLDAPLHWRKPRKVFVCSMSDLFHEDVPDNFINEVFAKMGMCRHHTFQVLTKRVGRMKAYLEHTAHGSRLFRLIDQRESEAPVYIQRAISAGGSWLIDWPFKNVWLGVSVSTQAEADEKIPILLSIPAAVRFVSIEPMLEEITVQRYRYLTYRELDLQKPGLDWVIVGAESGPNRRPCNIEWVRRVIDDCVGAGVPVFVKQIHDGKGKVVHMPTVNGQVWNQMPEVKP